MKREPLIILGLIAITLLAFSPVGQCKFLNFDDYLYIVNNPHVTTGLSRTNFVWAWSSFEQGNYLPLTWLSFMLDATLFGSGPEGFHRTNLLFHAANSVLVFLVFRRATGAIWRSALVAAIFAVHPLRVESVAWTVERKDVLTGFFGLLTMLAYLRYTRDLKWHWYTLTLLLFAATLLAKQVLATLPCVLLLLDYWPLGRWDHGPAAVGPEHRHRQPLSRLVLEKLPLVAMAAGIITVTFKAQTSTHSVANLKSVTLGWRLANVPVSYARYLGKTVWFGNLAPLYPRVQWTFTQVVASSLLLIGITAICFWKLRFRPWLAVGWLWFLGVLVPMIGVISFGPQAMADRFTYFASIGLVVMAAWSIPEPWFGRPRWPVAAVIIVPCILMAFTFRQTRYWRDSISLFSHDLAVVGSDREAEYILGKALRDRGQPGDLAAAIDHLQKAVNLDSARADGHGDLALALALNDQCPAALPNINAAILLDSKNADWHMVLAFILDQNKQYEQAAHEAHEAILLNPQSAQAHRLLGRARCEMGQTDEGIAELNLALRITPGLRAARLDLQKFRKPAIAK